MQDRTNTAKVIEVTGVFKIFPVPTGEVTVLKDINFEINRGEFTIIIGPSGCGKSTLLHIILGLEMPTSGSVKVLGVDLYSQNRDGKSKSDDQLGEFRKTNIGMIYQQPQWIRSQSVLDNVALALLLNGVPRPEAIGKAHQMLNKVGMLDWSGYFPTELSSGQQQKVALARALVTDPQLLIADEPTGNLDLESGKELMGLLTDLNQEGKSIIMVTHDLEYLDYATRTIKMIDGNIESNISKRATK